MAYTEEEKQIIREAMEYLKSIEEGMKTKKKKELRGGAFPLLAVLFTIGRVAASVIPRIVQVARFGVQAARGLANVGRTALQSSRQVARQFGKQAIQTGRQATKVNPVRTATQTTLRQKLATGANRLVNVAGLGLTIGMEVANNMSDGMVSDEQAREIRAIVEEENPRTPIQRTAIGDITEDNVDKEVEGDETDQPLNITPIRFNPRIRNVYAMGESRNPLQSGQYSNLLLARQPTTRTTISRDLTRLRGGKYKKEL